ncbi:hypothetical protein BVY01_04745 [bacterium I07]|nr:hypothetical protein BVY01_04745 [bacterium I07]
MPENRKKSRLKEWGPTFLEIAKWVVVIALLWPLRQAHQGPIDFLRVLLGVLLFIIFTGKLFYDTIIMSILKRKRFSKKQDLITLIGMVFIISLVVGLLMLFVGYLMVEFFRMANERES